MLYSAMMAAGNGMTTNELTWRKSTVCGPNDTLLGTANVGENSVFLSDTSSNLKRIDNGLNGRACDY